MRLFLDKKEIEAALLMCREALESTSLNTKGACGHMLIKELQGKLKSALGKP